MSKFKKLGSLIDDIKQKEDELDDLIRDLEGSEVTFNGVEGIVIFLDAGNKLACVSFDGREMYVNIDDLN